MQSYYLMGRVSVLTDEKMLEKDRGDDYITR